MRTPLLLVALASGALSSVARAEEPNEVVEKTLKTYCEKNKVDRAKLESFKLDLIPETQTFRYTLPPLKAPAEAPYEGFEARSAFLIVDTKSGKTIEIKAAKYGYSITQTIPEIFAALKAAGAKIKTDADATKVMRALIYLDRAARQTEVNMKVVNGLKSQGRRFRDDEYEGGLFSWTHGDRIGLKVDKDDFATSLSGGHIK